VIMLLEITPEKRASKDECLAATRDEILRLRAGKTRDEILARMTEQLGVEVATNAEALMTRVPVVEQTEVAEAAKP